MRCLLKDIQGPVGDGSVQEKALLSLYILRSCRLEAHKELSEFFLLNTRLSNSSDP